MADTKDAVLKQPRIREVQFLVPGSTFVRLFVRQDDTPSLYIWTASVSCQKDLHEPLLSLIRFLPQFLIMNKNSGSVFHSRAYD